jgi:hypothetical protein
MGPERREDSGEGRTGEGFACDRRGLGVERSAMAQAVDGVEVGREAVEVLVTDSVVGECDGRLQAGWSNVPPGSRERRCCHGHREPGATCGLESPWVPNDDKFVKATLPVRTSSALA